MVNKAQLEKYLNKTYVLTKIRKMPVMLKDRTVLFGLSGTALRLQCVQKQLSCLLLASDRISFKFIFLGNILCLR